MLKRFLSFKISGVRIKAEYGGIEQTVITDEEGYFEFRLKPKYPLTKTSSWQKVGLTLIDHIVPHQPQVKAEGLIYIPDDGVSYGIISNIDDTIVSTGATRLWEMFKTTFFHNAHTRVPFPGVSAFYSALAKGNSSQESNPFFIYRVVLGIYMIF